MDNVEKIIVGFFTMASGVVSAGIPYIIWRSKKEVTAIVFRLDKLEKYHSKNSFVEQIKQAEKIWYEMDATLTHDLQKTSAQIAQKTRTNALRFYSDISTDRFTWSDYEVALRKLKAIVEIEKTVGRKEMPCFSEDEHVKIDTMLLFHISRIEAALENLALDNVFNDKQERLQEIMIRFFTGYRADIIHFLMNKQMRKA
jgi:hypothetical protein